MPRTRAFVTIAFLAAGCGASSYNPCPGGVCPDGGAADRPPADAAADVLAADAGPTSFTAGHVYLAGARNAQIFEYALVPGSGTSPGTLELVSQWTHPSFYPDYASAQDLPRPWGQPPGRGPGGIAFDGRGSLAVAALRQICVFSAPGTLVGCHDKVPVSVDGGVPDGGLGEASENLIFDIEGNLYTVSSSGRRDRVVMYGRDFGYFRVFPVATGGTSGIACDRQHNLYVASQETSSWPYYSSIYAWAWADGGYAPSPQSIRVKGLVEGLLAVDSTVVLAACHDDDAPDAGLGAGIRRFSLADGGLIPPLYQDPGGDAGLIAGLVLPLAVTVDKDGNIYTADWESRLGTSGAALYVFAPTGALLAKRTLSEVNGPGGIAVAGTVLYCNPPSQ
jgi:hypothetical protein